MNDSQNSPDDVADEHAGVTDHPIEQLRIAAANATRLLEQNRRAMEVELARLRSKAQR